MEPKKGLVVCEVLKVLFNLTVNSSQEDTQELVTNMEGWEDPLKALLQPTDLAHPAVRDKHHRDIVVNVLDCFLDLLSHKLAAAEGSSSLKEDISPCLSVLWSLARTWRPARKYLKSVILPPLTAEVVMSKPESAPHLKGQLVSL